MTRGRSIRLFLADGTPGGIITAEIMNWTGHVMIAPRSRLADLIQRSEVGRTGVYVLSGTDPAGGFQPLVYVGETDNVGKRLAQHNKDDAKEFWEQTCVVTSKDQNLTKAHVRYLESRLIAIAAEAGRAKLVNGTAPDYGLLPEADLADMEYFIEQLRVVLPVLTLDFLKETASKALPVATSQGGGIQSETPSSVGSLPALDRALGAASGKVVSPRVRPSQAGVTSPIFELRDPKFGLVARAVELDGEMVILKGSQARKEEGDSLTGSLRQRRLELKQSGVLVDDSSNPKLFVFNVDTPMRSPSQASTLVLARSDNGRLSWYVQDSGRTYANWQEEQVAAVAPQGGEE